MNRQSPSMIVDSKDGFADIIHSQWAHNLLTVGLDPGLISNCRSQHFKSAVQHWGMAHYLKWRRLFKLTDSPSCRLCSIRQREDPQAKPAFDRDRFPQAHRILQQVTPQSESVPQLAVPIRPVPDL